MTLLLTSIGALLLFSGLITMVEAAVFSVPLSRVHLLVEKNRKGSHRLLSIKKNLQRTIVTLVVLNNASNIGGAIFIGWRAQKELGSTWMAAFTVVFTLLIIVIAELIPKTIGERFAASIAVHAAPCITFVERLILPLIWAIEKLSLPFARRSEPQVGSEEEIRVLANVGNKAGSISPQESELIRKAFLLNDVTAKDIMTHRLKVSQLPAEKSLSDLDPQEIDKLHSRILVTEEGDLDKVQGVIYQRDILLALARGKTELTVDDVKNAAHFVYEATPAHRLLREFQRTRQHLFVVVDEYGGTSGVVSLEDVLEELVGEIEDEVDAREKSAVNSRYEYPRKAEGRAQPGHDGGLPASESTDRTAHRDRPNA